MPHTSMQHTTEQRTSRHSHATMNYITFHTILANCAPLPAPTHHTPLRHNIMRSHVTLQPTTLHYTQTPNVTPHLDMISHNVFNCTTRCAHTLHRNTPHCPPLHGTTPTPTCDASHCTTRRCNTPSRIPTRRASIQGFPRHTRPTAPQYTAL